MFDKVQRAAERMATGVSRRAFFGGVGRLAAVAAAAASGLAGVASAGPPNRACGTGSSALCVGKSEGDRCYIGRSLGRCRYSPACICVAGK